MALLMTLLLVLLPALVLAPRLQAEDNVTQSVNVTVTEINISQGGTLIVGLYRGKDDWLDVESAHKIQRIPVSSETQSVQFEDVEPDSSYAVAVIHDKNENGRMDLRKFPFPKPKEGVGVSNNKIGLGPPSYRKAEFSVTNAPVTTTIILDY
jgi:uncharacterized protein (DUF2141 family)